MMITVLCNLASDCSLMYVEFVNILCTFSPPAAPGPPNEVAVFDGAPSSSPSEKAASLSMFDLSFRVSVSRAGKILPRISSSALALARDSGVASLSFAARVSAKWYASSPVAAEGKALLMFE